MSLFFRWLLRLFIGMALFVFAALALAYFFTSRSIPDYSASYVVPALSAPVEIVRDNANVPHIFGQQDADIYFGLGFAHAQDRLWQMTMLRRTAQGRLSELFGERTVRTDDLMRRLDLYTLASRSFDAQSGPAKIALRAYAAGVNAWLEEVNIGARGRGAPELFLFSPQIAPWRPADSIAIIKLMAVQGSSHMQQEVLRARTARVLPDARLKDILPDAPGSAVAALPEYQAQLPVPSIDLTSMSRDPLSPVRPRAFSGASNAWAAAPSRSASGGTLLANDPHLPFSAPAIWYLARLGLTTGSVIGATIPGAPAVIIGRSDVLGWGITTAYADDQDLYFEQVNPENTTEVMTPAGFKPLRTRTTIVRIKDRDPITLTLRWSENGPILPAHHYDLNEVLPPGHVAALAWTALSPDDTSITAAIDLMSAQTIADGIDAGEKFIAPAQNLVLADQSEIAMKLVGVLPARDPGHRTQGRLPSDGWLAVNRWQGRLPYDDNPEFVSPQGGILRNTNNKSIDRPFPNHVSWDWGDTQRIQRWKRLMQSREVHTRESFLEAQLDTVSPTARTLLPLVGADLWFTGEPALDGTPARLRQRALELLADWNGEMNEHLPEPLIYAAWMRALQDRLIRDEMGPLTEEFAHLDPVFVERVFRNTGGAAVWCDVLQSEPVESCQDIARQSLDAALIWISERYGTALESLRWGDAHEATHDHPVLGTTPILRWLTNIRQSTSGGDFTLQRGLTSGTDPDPFLNVHGAGYRGVYDFADPDSSVFIIATGQSGHPLSRHYDDLGDLWRRGEYIPMTLDPDLARAAAVGITTLTP